MDNVTDVIFFIVSKVHFLLLLSKRWIRENNKYTKNAKKRYYVNHRMRWRCSFHFRYVINKIMFTSQIYFVRNCRWRDPKFLSAKFWTTQLDTFIRQKPLKTMFLFVCKIYIFFWFYGSIGSEGNNKYAKKGIKVSHGMPMKKKAN